MADTVAFIVDEMRSQSPLIQCITNFVSMDLVPNVLLAAGASPAMVLFWHDYPGATAIATLDVATEQAHSVEEVEDFVGIANSVFINIGTLEPSWVASMKLAAAECQRLGKHWVLDPVGAGATSYRTRAALALLKLQPAVLRGNAGEILAISGVSGAVKGVDSASSVQDAEEAAQQLAATFKCVVAVSGAVDYVRSTVILHTPSLGCFANGVTALITAMCAVHPDDFFMAATAALVMFGLAGQLALSSNQALGPGSMRTALIDNLYNMSNKDILEGAQVELY